MQVDVLSQTGRPESIVCTAARGDYYDGYVGDSSFEEIMDPISYRDEDLEWSIDHLSDYDEDRIDVELVAKQRYLIHELFDRGHFGPFEHVTVTFGIEGMSRSCMAQITRHRHASFDIQSMRYVDFSKKDDPTVVPASLNEDESLHRGDGLVGIDRELRDELRSQYLDHGEQAFDLYKQLVANGVPKEDARFVLPIGTKVNGTMTVNARSLMHVLDMRYKSDAQWEIRDMSEQMLECSKDWMPITFDHYDDKRPNKLAP